MQSPKARYLMIASASLVLWFPLASPADTVGYWRFEPGGLLLDSSPEAIDLTNEGGDNTNDAYTLPTSGVGSKFKGTIPATGLPNVQGALFGSSESPRDRFSVPDDETFDLYESNEYTIEAYINLSSSASRSTICSKWSTSTSNRTFDFFVASDADSSPHTLKLSMFGFTDSFASRSATYVPNLNIATNTDYYVAVSVDLRNTGVDFYLRDLTNNGILQTVHFGISDMTIAQGSTTDFRIGSISSGDFWSGLLDEIRFSDVALGQNELLMVPEPAISGLALMILPPLVARRRRAYSGAV